MTDPALRHTALTEQIIAEQFWGSTTLTDPAWRNAWDAMPRHLFVPDAWFTWDPNACEYAAHDRAAEPDAWWDAVFADEPVITQVGGGVPTCSNSAPSLVAAMLGALDVADGMTVFESGAGTGWTSSLLAARLGDDRVVSVEFDAGLAASARVAAAAAGRSPLIAAGDGETGYPGRAPFDRVSATHSVARIPAAWIGQTSPGGLVCAPLRIGGRLDLFVTLTVAADGSASGPVRFPVAFMSSRAGRSVPAELVDGPGRERTGHLDVPAIVAAKELWAVQMAVQGLVVTGPLLEDGDDTVWLQTPDGSWAVAWVPQGASWEACTVQQHGPRDVWTIAEEAYAGWLAAGRPALDRYGLTVDPDGTHRIWLDEPARVIATL